MYKFSGVQRASAMKVNFGVCALTTARDLESASRKSSSVRIRQTVNSARTRQSEGNSGEGFKRY